MSMDYEVRLGASIKFDPEKEMDIIEGVKNLTSKHRLGAYISTLLRYVWDNPEKFKGTDVDFENFGITSRRQEFINSVYAGIRESQRSIEDIRREVLTLSTAAKVGATFGLVEKTEDIVMGLEVLDNYLTGIKNMVGVQDIRGVFDRKVSTKAEDIANSAANILIQMMISKNVDMRVKGTPVTTGVVDSGVKVVEKVVTPTEQVKKPEDMEIVDNKSVEEKQSVERKEVQSADDDALKSFVGMSDTSGSSSPQAQSETSTAGNEDLGDEDLLSQLCGF